MAGIVETTLTDDTYISYGAGMERKPTRFEIRLPPALADAIDGWRRAQADIPPRAEAARRLIEMAVNEIEKGKIGDDQ